MNAKLKYIVLQGEVGFVSAFKFVRYSGGIMGSV